MAGNQELMEFVVKAMGQESVASLKDELNYTRASLGQLEDAYNRGEISTQKFLQTADRLTRQEQQQVAMLQSVTRAQDEQAGSANRAGDATAAATGKMGAGAGNAAYKLQQLGGTLDDLQYVGEQGLRPILNNIMQISPAAGIALLAFDLIRRSINAFTGDTKEGQTEVEKLKARIKELSDKPHKIQLDIDALNAAEAKLTEMERRLAAFEAGRQTASQADLAKQALDVTRMYAGGSPELQKAIMASETVSHGKPEEEEELRQIRNARENAFALAGDDPQRQAEASEWFARHHGKRSGELEANVQAANEKYAKEEAGSFVAGDEQAIQRMKNRARDFPGRFAGPGPGGITAAEAIRDMPSTQAEAVARANADEENKAIEESIQERVKQVQERNKRRKAERDAAIKQGRAVIKAIVGDVKYDRKEIDAGRSPAPRAATGAGASGKATVPPAKPVAILGSEAGLSSAVPGASPATAAELAGGGVVARNLAEGQRQAADRFSPSPAELRPPDRVGRGPEINPSSAPGAAAFLKPVAEAQAGLAQGQVAIGGQVMAIKTALSVTNAGLAKLRAILNHSQPDIAGSSYPYGP